MTNVLAVALRSKVTIDRLKSVRVVRWQIKTIRDVSAIGSRIDGASYVWVPNESEGFERMRMTVEADSGVATLINVFTVTAERQAALVESLRAFTEKHVRGLPGFIGAAVHMSVDGTQVVNYAQWSSAQEMKQMLASPSALLHLQDVRELAEVIQPHVYEVAYVGSRETVP